MQKRARRKPRNVHQEFSEHLGSAEDEVIEGMARIIRSKIGGDTSEAAKVTASIKVLELLTDPMTPQAMLTKMEYLRVEAVESLRDVVNLGSVAAAQANAGAYLLKAIKSVAPGAWPPDTTTKEWIDRMARAEAMSSNERQPDTTGPSVDKDQPGMAGVGGSAPR